MNRHYDIAIIGSGPAGLSAELYVKRAGLTCAVIGKDGGALEKAEKALRQAQENRGSGRPTVVIAVTTKGKGVSFMENDILWHYRTPQGEEYDAALAELEAQRP